MPKATPQHLDDPTVYKDYKPEKLGSGIRIEPMPLSKGTKEDYMGKGKANLKDTMPIPLSKGTKEDYMGTSKPSTKPDPDIKPLAKGGHVHHSEHYGKHAAGYKLHEDHVKAMCGGGYAKGKK